VRALLGCAVIRRPPANTEQQLEAIAHFQPSGYLGTPDFLKVLLDAAAKAGRRVAARAPGSSSGAALAGIAAAGNGRRAASAVLQCDATADLGVIAYESQAREGMIVNRDLLVEIVRPGTGDPVVEGEVGASS